MAQLAAALPYITAASTALAVGAQIQQSQAQSRNLELQARQDKEEANAAQAEAQREAEYERKRARNLASRARAVAGASGAGVSDPTVSEIFSDIETQGEVNALNAMVSGNTAARGLNLNAAARRNESTAVRTAGYVSGASTALGGATSWYGKYGGGRGYTTGYGDLETVSTPDAGDLRVRRPYINF